MNKERWEIVEGIGNAVELMQLPVDNMSPEYAIVFYGKDDKVTLEEAKEVLGLKRKVA